MAAMTSPATLSPTATPKIHSTALLKVCPAKAPTHITAAMAAMTGRSLPRMSEARYHARLADIAV